MIGSALRIDIEQYAGRCETQGVMFTTVSAGNFTREMLGRYLASVHYMISHTPIHLRRARDRSQELGETELAAHFAHKISEEVGHDAWSERDLRANESSTQLIRPAEMPSARGLARYMEEVIDEHPALYLSYIAFAEYVTVMLGPKWLALLELHSGVPRTQVSAIDNHAELDREHAEEGFSVMDDLVTDPRMLARMREVLAASIALFDGYCAEAIRGIPAAEESSPDLAHVSAA